MARAKTFDPSKIRDKRKKSGMNQHDYWSRFGVTQSGGSRYEAGRDIPTPTAMLVFLAECGFIDDKVLETARKAVLKSV